MTASAPSALSILVVHPDHQLASRLATTLTSRGHEVVVVPDGERAIDRFIQQPLDMLVVEMVLPGRDGGTTVESIRWSPGGGEAKVILLGSRGTPAAQLKSAGDRVDALAILGGGVNVDAIADLADGVALAGRATRDAVAPGASRPLSAEVWTDATTRPGGPTDRVQTPKAPTGSAGPKPTWSDDLYTEIDEELTGSWGPGDLPGAEIEGAAVERRAESMSAPMSAGEDDEPENDLRGDLRRTAFPRLLHKIALEKRNGALVLDSTRDRRRTTSGESPKKVVFFRSGVPRYVQSNLLQECLGQVLARGGHITHAILEESVDRMRRGEGRQGAVLLSMGAITPHQLRDALEDQLRVKLFDLFAWSDGSFEFQSDAKAPPETVTLEMSLPEIVVKGVVHRIPPQRLLDRLSPNLDRYVVPDRIRLGRFMRVPLAPEAKRVLHALDGTMRLSEILEGAGGRPGAAAQLVYALGCVDAVRLMEEPEPTVPLGENEIAESSAITTHIATLREELRRLGRLLRAEKWVEALGVDGRDPARAAARADQLRARFHPVTEQGAAPRELRALAYEVCARLVHARDAITAPPGQRKSPLELSQRGFDADVPTRDEKGSTRTGRRYQEPQRPDDFQSATPSEPGRPTVPEPGRRTVPELQRITEASRELSTSVARPRRTHDFGDVELTVPPASLNPEGSVPPARLGTPDGEGTVSPHPSRITALVDDVDRGDFETQPEEGSTAEQTGRHGVGGRPKSDAASDDPEGPTQEEPPAEAPASSRFDQERTITEDGDSDVLDTSPLDSRDDSDVSDVSEISTASDSEASDLSMMPDSEPWGDSTSKEELGADEVADSPLTQPTGETGPSLDEQVDRLYQAERHFRRGERALRRGKTEVAVAAFEHAVSLCPDEGEFVSHLGYARYQAAAAGDDDPGAREHAIEELVRGAELAPKLDITHLLLARVLADGEDRARARDAFGRALAANPDCAEALAGLHALDLP